MENQDAFEQAIDKSAFLLEKWQYWVSENRISNFYDNRIEVIADTPAVEMLQNGYISVAYDYIEYSNFTTGNYSRIVKNWNDNDVFATLKLYEKSQQLNSFRVDNLSYHKLVQFQGTDCLYSEFTSPNSQYGQSYSEEILGTQRPTNETIILKIREHIDQTKILLDVAKQVSTEIGCGFPKLLCDPGNRYKDDVGTFYSGINKWDTDLASVIKLGLEFLNQAIHIMFKSNSIDTEQKTELLNYAETLWNQT
jgi:hypothetical protein